MSPIWDPQDVIQFVNNNRCCGYAPSKKRNCNARIKAENMFACKSILDSMSERQPNSEAVNHHLHRLAQYGLCVRYHRSQAEEMVEKWWNRIEKRFPSQPEEVPRASSRRDSVMSLPSTPVNTGVESEEVRRRPRCTSESPPQLPYDETNPEAVNENISRLSNIPTQTQSPRNSAATPGTSPRENDTAACSGSRQTSQRAAVPPPCSADHVRRLSLDEDCCICLDSALLSTCDPSELVWCRFGCGHSVHRSCFESWRSQCVAHGSNITCCLCRSDWGPDCGCRPHDCTCVKAPAGRESPHLSRER